MQEIIRQRPRREKGTPQAYPLKGLLKCGNCHRTLSRVHSSAGYYYRCTKSRADIDSKLAAAKAEQDTQEDDVFTSFAWATELTAELAGTFIKEVLVSSPTEIEIVWKFRDVPRRRLVKLDTVKIIEI